MTILQFIGCLIFNLSQYNFIIQNKEDKNIVLNRSLFAILMTIALIGKPHLFISFVIVKAVYDIVSVLIKFEASGILTRNYKEILIDDLISLIAFIVYVGG